MPLIELDEIDVFDENNLTFKVKELNLKLLKQRTLNLKETLKNCNYEFYEKINDYERVNNNIVVISDIILNDFIFNITPYGLKKLKKDEFLGIEEAKKRIQQIEEEQERKKKEKEKGDPGAGKFTGPGER